MRDDRIIRAYRFLLLMQRRRVRPTAKEIAMELDVSLRQAWRYIAAAQVAHVPMPPTIDQVEGA